MVHLGGRLDHRRGPVAVGPLHGGNAFRERQPRLATVGHRADDRTEVDVARGRQHLDLVLPALAVGSALHFRQDRIEGLDHERVGEVVVVAVLGGAVQAALAEDLVLLEIQIQDPPEFLQRKTLLVEDELLQRGEAVGQAADAHELDEGVVVPRPPRCSRCPWRMQSSVMTERNGAGMSVAYICSMS